MKSLRRILFSAAALTMVVVGVVVFEASLHVDPKASRYSNSDTDKSMFIERVDTRLEVGSDGSLTVSEVLRYDLGSVAWRGLYQDVILAGGERVKSVSVARLDSGDRGELKPGSGIELGVGGAYGTYGYGVIKDPDRRLRIVWNVNDSGVHSFRVRYRLGGAVKNYRDASSLLWDAWGKGWETGVGAMHVAVRFPGPIKLFFPRAGDLQRRVSGTSTRGTEGSFSVRDLPAGRQIQIQAAAAPLTGAPQRPGEVLPKIRAEQSQIDARNADLARRSAELKKKPYVWFLLRALIGALLAVLIVALCARTIGRDRTRPVPAGGSYQYPPEEIPPPVIAEALGGAETKDLVSSTLLGFLQRDVFRVLPSVEKREDVSIRNLVGETTFDRAKVDDFELPIAELLQAAIDKHPEHSPDFTKLKKYLSAKDAEVKISHYEKGLKAQFASYGLKSTYRGRVRRWAIGLFGLGVWAISLFACLGNSGGNLAARYDEMQAALYLIGFGPVLLWAAIEGNAFYRLKADQAERVRKWETYQDFFQQMDMSREYPLTVEIWDSALLYAAAFGFAKEVITNMPRTDEHGVRVGAGETTGLGWMSGSAWALGSFDKMSSGISGVTGMASSSSSGGGGFSGGGSGGGGGGGW